MSQKPDFHRKTIKRSNSVKKHIIYLIFMETTEKIEKNKKGQFYEKRTDVHT